VPDGTEARIYIERGAPPPPHYRPFAAIALVFLRVEVVKPPSFGFEMV
jgi:hypothetical protein